jgi:hypothetical protein
MYSYIARQLAKLDRDEEGALSVETIILIAVAACAALALLYFFRNPVLKALAQMLGWFLSRGQEATQTDNTTNTGDININIGGGGS